MRGAPFTFVGTMIEKVVRHTQEVVHSPSRPPLQPAGRMEAPGAHRARPVNRRTRFCFPSVLAPRAYRIGARPMRRPQPRTRHAQPRTRHGPHHRPRHQRPRSQRRQRQQCQHQQHRHQQRCLPMVPMVSWPCRRHQQKPSLPSATEEAVSIEAPLSAIVVSVEPPFLIMRVPTRRR